MGAVVSQAAVTRFRDVQIPGVTVHVEVEAGRLHEPPEVVETHPPADRTLRQRVGDDRPAARCGRHRSPALAAGLPLDGVDAVELVQQRVPEPPFPDAAQRFRRRCVQGGAAGFRQRQPGSTQFGQLGRLHEARPGERPDRTDLPDPLGSLARGRVEEVAAGERLGDALARGGGRPSRAGAHGDAASLDQPQHCQQVVLRGPFHVAPLELHPNERLLVAGVGPGEFDGLGQLLHGRHLGLRRRRHERSQALRQIRRNDRRLGDVAARRVEEEVQGRGPRAVSGRAESVRQPPVLRLELVLIEDGGRRVQGFTHGELLNLVEPRPQLPQGVAGEPALDGGDHVRLARGRRRRDRQQGHHRPEDVGAQKRERFGYRRRGRRERASHVA